MLWRSINRGGVAHNPPRNVVLHQLRLDARTRGCAPQLPPELAAVVRPEANLSRHRAPFKRQLSRRFAKSGLFVSELFTSLMNPGCRQATSSLEGEATVTRRGRASAAWVPRGADSPGG
jgi:hypothetical protein